MTEWKKARKKPVIVEFREVEPTGASDSCECIETREGRLYGYVDQDFIIRGVRGEIYPIKKDIFYETYELIEEDSGLLRTEEARSI